MSLALDTNPEILDLAFSELTYEDLIDSRAGFMAMDF